MLRRATSMPASASWWILSAPATAGPSVQTMLALLTGRPYPPPSPPAIHFRGLTQHIPPDREGAGIRRERGGESGRPGEVGVDGGSGRTALGDRPHDQRLPASGIAGHEHAIDARHVVLVA